MLVRLAPATSVMPLAEVVVDVKVLVLDATHLADTDLSDYLTPDGPSRDSVRSFTHFLIHLFLYSVRNLSRHLL